MDGTEEYIFFLHILWLKWNFFLMSKFNMKACSQMKFRLFCSKKEGHIFSNMSQNYQKLITIFGLFWDKQVCGSLTPKTIASSFDDSESCDWCGDLGTWVDRWSKWSSGVTILSHNFHANVVREPSNDSVSDKRWKIGAQKGYFWSFRLKV